MLAALRRIATRVGARHPEIVEIRLFGSLARGERNPYADADLLIVLEASDVPYRDRLPIHKSTDAPVPMDLTICTRAELARELGAGNRFVHCILRESIALYSREGSTSPRSGADTDPLRP